MSFTLIIVVITVIVSYAAFNNDALMNKLILWPRQMNSPEEYYRFLTSGFIHADWNHLIFNMLTLYFFGQNIEDGLGVGAFIIVLYLTGIVVAGLPSYLKNRNNSYYRSLGASGGVSSIVFFTIYFFPWNRIQFFFIPIGIPSIVFAIGYLAYSAYMSKSSGGNNRDVSRWGGNINHDAHIWGSVYGFVFAIIYDPSHGLSFIEAIMHPY